MTTLGGRRRGARRGLVRMLVAGSVLASGLAVMGSGAITSADPPEEPPFAQYPFVCTTARNGLGQPKIDNQEGRGIPVAQESSPGVYPKDSRGYPTQDAVIIGWSEDCDADPIVEYIFRTTSGGWANMPNQHDLTELPANIAYVEIDGEEVPYIVRWEKGVINRYLYSVAMLAPVTETDPWDPDTSLWNNRLVYHFGGGVGIGFFQGTFDNNAARYHQALELGYAVIWSSGTRTSTHYNLVVGGQTAVALKDHFVNQYGEPIYTIGVGGSGGGIQQYIYAQNHPGLLDGGVPQYSYPDMVTQTIHIGDCELLAHYFEVTGRANPRWRDIRNQSLVMGLNAERAPTNLGSSITQWQAALNVMTWLGYGVADWPGSNVPLTECRRAWTGLTPSAMNPTFQTINDIDKLAQGIDGVEFTHWRDAANVYGVDENGWARVPWDNVGVQYGLRAVADGRISPEEFLHLNAFVGSWKHTSEQVVEGLPYINPNTGKTPDTNELLSLVLPASTPGPAREFLRQHWDPWSSRNMRLSPDGTTPAPRRRGDPLAIQGAFENGHVFRGEIDIPMIDWRHYLERELDMHNTVQSFATRQRYLNAQGNHDSQIIWFTDGRPARAFDQTPMAFEVLDEWIMNMKADPELSVAEAKPALAKDACFDTAGELIAMGDDVWDGILNDAPDGACTQKFKVYSTSRIEAGAPITGDTFACELVPVAEAVDAGVYGLWQPTAAQLDRLEEIFPDGVCDFPPNASAKTFGDVPDGSFFDTASQWLKNNDITTGFGGNTAVFNPNGLVTRGQMAALLWRAAGQPPASGGHTFTDVPAGAFYDEAVAWLLEQHITTGWGGSSSEFRPDGEVTRGQIAAFLWRAAGSPAPSGWHTFTDVPAGAFYDEAVAWLLEQRITTGWGGSSSEFRPGSSVTRGQMAAFLYRAWQAKWAGFEFDLD